jgi:hypothetical protein
VSDPADLTHRVLLRVAEFLRKLPVDQLAELAEGTAKLEVVPRGGRRPARAAKPSPVTAEQVRAELTKIGDRAAARRWIEDQRLTVPQLKTLAKELGISVPAKATKSVVLDQIVQWTIGRRLDSEAISRPAPARL